MTDTTDSKHDGAASAMSAGLDAVQCPNCPNQGWYAWESGGCGPDGENDTRQCEQVQCEFCWSTPNSAFNIEAANVELSGARSASDLNAKLGRN